jgi:hypothetical protein
VIVVPYELRVKLKSNEAPWSGAYQPALWHQPANDDAAIKWAVGMSDGLGDWDFSTVTPADEYGDEGYGDESIADRVIAWRPSP